jgi:hypothetical protein
VCNRCERDPYPRRPPIAANVPQFNRREYPFRLNSTQPMKKNLMYYGIIALVAIVAVKVVYPFVQPYLAKIPVAGNLFTA